MAVAASGCTGTDFLESGNSPVRIQVVAMPGFQGEFDCVMLELNSVRFRPLTGTCGADSAPEDVGQPCHTVSDCPGGTCVGSTTEDLIGDAGISVWEAEDSVLGDLWNGPCAPENPTIQQFLPQLTQDVFANPDPLILSAGLYEISSFDIKSVTLYKDDLDFALVDWRECPNDVFAADILGDALRFTVVQGQDKLIQFTLDVDALDAAYVNPGSTNCGSESTGTGLRGNLADILECTTCDAGVVP
jgi:hypothetical protein